MSDNSFDDLRNIFDTFLEMGGQKFDVERNDVIIATYDGLTNTCLLYTSPSPRD